MNAEGIRRCVEEKEAVAAARAQLAAHAARLEKECGLYERDLERAMESCDELARESDDLRNRLRDAPDLTEQVQALQRDKEILKTNLNKAEEEVKLLFEENRALDEANKRLLCLLEKEQKHRSERKHSASNSTKQKRKSSSLKDTSPVSLAIDFNSADASRQPLLPLQPNSPDCRVHKK
uniref:NUDE domain-containing protein n=1 Tax=Aegilops tauschii TaxID=37682 RepID=R7WDZ5_AEGTA